MLKTLILSLLLAGVANAQSTRITPPQVDYSRYGSLSRQMTVYKNVQGRLDAMDLRRERRRAEAAQRRVARRLSLLRSHERALGCYNIYSTTRRVVITVRQ